MRKSCISWAIIVALVMTCGMARAADPQEVLDSIHAGADSLLASASDWNTDEGDQGHRSLAAIALVKAKIPLDTPAIANAVQAVVAKCTAEGYRPRNHHYYEAGVDATLLVEVGGANFRPQLQIIADYILAGQLDHGGWDYPEGHDELNQTTYSGDTSVTQYAVLGLWAATRAGVEVPKSAFERVINWHIGTQFADGGFAYCPGTTIGHERGAPGLNLTAAGIGSVMIATMHLYPHQYDKLFTGSVENEDSPMGTTGLSGPLEIVDLDTPPETEVAPEGQSTIPLTRIQQSMRRAAGWLGARFVNYNQVGHVFYYYYAVERAASMAHVDTIGQYDWYNYCADHLLSIQKEDGSWSVAAALKTQDTSFAILFLVKSTGTIVGTPNPPDPAGQGLQIGNRGLPDNLDDAQVQADGTVTVPPNLGPTSDLLAALTDVGDINIEEVQQAIVRDVQIGDRNAWIERKDQLAELATHPNAEVRRTAIWALGRTGDMSLARFLISALEDPDIGVNIEANNALCWISRRPNGFSLSDDPLSGLPEDAGQDQKESIMAAWRSEAIEHWGGWYLRHRPFADRGDEFEANLRQQLGR